MANRTRRAVGRRYPRGLVAAAAVAICSIPIGAGGQDEGAGGGVVSEPRVLRLMTYNIHHAEGMDDRINVERVAKVIKDQEPDLVAVQEVDVKTRRARGVDQAAKIAELTEMHYVFGKFMNYSGGEYGQMVLSKFPIKSSKNHPLPPGPEPRTALEVRVDIPLANDRSAELVFVGNHLYATEAQRLAQAGRLAEILAEEMSPVVLAGDFNSSPLQPPMALLGKRWIDPTLDSNEFTWPSDRPKIEIDYVLYAPQQAFRFISSEVIAEKRASDHRPVLMLLEFRPGG